MPLLIDQLLAVLVGMADTFMVSSVSEAAVSGVSLVDTINMLFLTIFSGLATGGAVICAHFIGQSKSAGRNKDSQSKNTVNPFYNEAASHAANQLLLVILLISLLCAAICLSFHTFILKTIFGNVAKEVFSNASVYFFITALSLPFFAFYNGCAALFRSMGISKTPMYTSLFMNLLNIAGNAVLLYIFHMGVAGVAIATLASRITASFLIAFLLGRPKQSIQLVHITLRPDFSIIRKILSVGIPGSLELSIFQIGKILVLRLISSLGTVAITANAIANTLVTFQALAEDAVSLALITVVGQCIGANLWKQAKEYTYKLMKFTYLAMWLVNLSMLALTFTPFITQCFHLSSATAKTATILIRYNCLFGLSFWPVSFTLPNSLRAAQDVKFPLCVSFFSMWTFRVGLSWLFIRYTGLGIYGIYISFGVDWIFRAILFIFRFRKLFVQQKR